MTSGGGAGRVPYKKCQDQGANISDFTLRPAAGLTVFFTEGTSSGDKHESRRREEPEAQFF